MDTQIPYCVAKHPEVQGRVLAGTAEYQHCKRQLVGELDPVGAEARVQQFLRTRQGYATESRHPAREGSLDQAKSPAEVRPAGASPPFSAWLRTPLALSSFTLP